MAADVELGMREELDRLAVDMLKSGDSYYYDQVMSSVEYAELRCAEITELIISSTDVTSGKYYSAIKVLRERSAEMTSYDRRELASRIESAMSKEFRDQLSSKLRSRTDRLFGNLGDLLNQTDRQEMARSLCVHALSTRRKTAIRALRGMGLTDDDILALKECWRLYRDMNALYALTRVSGGLSGYNCCDLIEVASGQTSEWDLDFWNAIILERLICDKSLDHLHAVSAHPTNYIRAVGRARTEACEPFLLSAIAKLESPDALMLAASVAGRLRNKQLIVAIRIRLENLASAAA